MEDLSGKQLGPYQVIAPLGEGGMAAVYKAYHAAMDRCVAVKVLPQQLAKSDPQFIGRFTQEARLLAKLQHPHILPVFDFGEAEGYTYIVMPLVETGTLKDLLRGRPLPLRQIHSIVSQVGDALDYAHTRGLVHRDVKPSNVLVDERGNCLLTDFGIAKMVEATAHFTGTGSVIGTPAYMSPEQGRGKKVDARSDIYALGVMLFEMATGRVPFDAETPVAVIFMHVSDPLPPPRKLNPDLPAAVERVILKALAKNPDDRFQTARAAVDALQAAAETATVSDAGTAKKAAQASHSTVIAAPTLLPSAAARKPSGRFSPRVFVLAGALIMLCLLAGVAGAIRVVSGLAAGGIALASKTQPSVALDGGGLVVESSTLPPTLTPTIVQPTARPTPTYLGEPAEVPPPPTSLTSTVSPRPVTPTTRNTRISQTFTAIATQARPTFTWTPVPSTFTPSFTPTSSIQIGGQLSLITGSNGTSDNLLLKLQNAQGATLYQTLLDQPGDLQPGQVDVYNFMVAAAFCDLQFFMITKPAGPAGDDDWTIVELHLSLDGTEVFFDRDMGLYNPFTANSFPINGGWSGGADYKQRCES